MSEKQYYDTDGRPCSLDLLCRREPAWAANRLRAAEESLLDLVAKLKTAERRGAERELAAVVRWLGSASWPKTHGLEKIVAGLRSGKHREEE